MYTLTLEPGKTCQWNYDQYTENKKLYFADQDDEKVKFESGKFGQYVNYEVDEYVMYKGECVYEKTQTRGLEGIFMNYDEVMDTETENGRCKYYFYFSAANCGEDCLEEDRSISWFTYEDNTEQWGWWAAIFRVLRI